VRAVRLHRHLGGAGVRDGGIVALPRTVGRRRGRVTVGGAGSARAAGGFAAGAKMIFRSGVRPGMAHGGLPINDEMLLQIRRGVGTHKSSALISAVLAGMALGVSSRR